MYLDLLEELESEMDEFDVDALILYDENTDISALRKAADELAKSGMSVSAQRSRPEKLRYKKLLKLTERGVEEI